MTPPRGWVCLGDGFHAKTRKARQEHEQNPRCAYNGKRRWVRAKSPRGIYWMGVRVQVKAFSEAVHKASNRRRRR